MPLQEGKGEKKDFLRKDRNLCLSLMRHVDLVLSAHLHTYRDRGRIYDFRRAETVIFAISLPGWPGMCAIRGCGKHIRWTSILHHSRKPIITLSWKREKMLLLLQAILRTGRKCISPL